MSRTEENDKIIDFVTKQVEKGTESELTIKKLSALNQSMMVTMLADISRSLAILADKVEESGGSS